MKKFNQIALSIFILLLSIVFIPNFSKATTSTAGSDEELRSAIEKAADDDVIKLTTDISLIKPIEITGKRITINGDGFSISKNDNNWSDSGSNATLITSGIDAKVTLSNITLKNSKKYGAQAYNGGYLVLDNVTATDNGYGGILVNAGTVEVIKLSLGHNGLENSNNGIEIAKGKEIPDSEKSNQPKLIMNGELTSTQTENVIYLATNDKLTEFSVENTDTTKNQIFLSGNKVVVTDENNQVIFESNENDKIQLEGESFAKNITITVKLNDKTATVTVKENTILTKEDLTSKIDLASLGLSKYSITGFYTDEKYKTEYNFEDPITTDTTIYAKLKLNTTPKKDTSPKTGSEDTIGIALFTMALSTIALIVLKRKDI